MQRPDALRIGVLLLAVLAAACSQTTPAPAPTAIRAEPGAPSATTDAAARADVAVAPKAAETRLSAVDAGAPAGIEASADPSSGPADADPKAGAPQAPAQANGSYMPSAADDEAVREAVLRHMFKKNASGMQENAQVYCLEFENNTDPPAAFLSRFRGFKQAVKAASGCNATAQQGVVDKSTGKRGLVFRIDSATWTDAMHATVNGGYYEAGLSASGNVYSLEKKNGKWIVIKDQMMWIS